MHAKLPGINLLDLAHSGAFYANLGAFAINKIPPTVTIFGLQNGPKFA
jgi:hypothetical protein